MTESTSDSYACIHCKRELARWEFGTRSDTGKRIGSCKACVKRLASERKESTNFVPRKQRYDNLDGTRTCRICNTGKQLEEFPIRNAERGTRRNECTPCLRERGRERYAEDPEKHRDAMRRALFGLESGKYAQMLAAQGGVCALCSEPERSANRFNGNRRRLFVDHDHLTGAVRQLLCQKCNFGLGQFRDDPELMERAASYIRRHRLES